MQQNAATQARMDVRRFISQAVINNANLEERMFLREYIQTGSYQETADVLGVNKSTSYTRVRKAIERFYKRNLIEMLDEEAKGMADGQSA